MEEKEKNSLSLVDRQSTYKLIITELVQRKIKEWCLQFPDLEWSGTLFYTVEGSFADGTFTATCRDIYVSDIGTGGYTEFDHKADIVTYADENDLLDCHQGLIHSHNKMATFFSGTDKSTLIEEGMSMPHFLSLIVNNAGKYTAKITRRVTLSTSSITYPTYGQNKVTEEVETTVNEYLEAFPLDIEIAEDNVRAEVLQRIEEIRKEKAKPVGKTFYSPVMVFPREQDKKKFTPWEEDWRKDLKEHKPEVSQPTLFNKEELGELRAPEGLVDRLTVQLLTGSVMSGMSGTFDLDKWIPNMDRVYKNRFKTDIELEAWLDLYIEFLVWNTEWPGSDLEDPDEVAQVLADALYDRVEALFAEYKEVDVLNSIIDKLDEFRNK